MKTKLIILAVTVIALQACFPDEEPVSPYDRGGTQVYSMDSSNIYEKQIFFDLGTNSIVLENDVYSWDIAFDCRQDSFHIIVNLAKTMMAANFGKVGFLEDLSGKDSLWNIDRTNGNLDSASKAIGDWWSEIKGQEVVSKGDMYLINLGLKSDGRKYGFRRLIIDGYSDGKYRIRFTDKSGNNEVSAEIPKTPGVQFVYFSFTNSQVLNLEPPEDKWDLLFTRYTYYYDSLGILYGVNGVFLNRKNVKAVQLTTDKAFEDIVMSDVTGELSSRMDTIGFDWKGYDLEKQIYYVYTKKYYIIQDFEGFFYKFHFLDFYNKNGVKGFPTFEFMKL